MWPNVPSALGRHKFLRLELNVSADTPCNAWDISTILLEMPEENTAVFPTGYRESKRGVHTSFVVHYPPWPLHKFSQVCYPPCIMKEDLHTGLESASTVLQK